MKTMQQSVDRVHQFTEPRLRRARDLFGTKSKDPRGRRGLRHTYPDCMVSLLCGIASGRKAMRDVETQSGELGLGRQGHGISDGTLSYVLKKMDERSLDDVLVQSVRDMRHRRELVPVDLNQSWTAIDGKYETLSHDCGGLAQLVVNKNDVHFRLGVLRAVLITAAGRPALGQWVMPPVAGEQEKDPEKRKHTGETTNLPGFVAWLRAQYGDLTGNFTLDAGLWSKALFLTMDAQGLGLFCGLKGNKPELFAEAKRVLRRVRSKKEAMFTGAWESCPKGLIRRRLWRTAELDGWNGWTHLRQVVVVEQTTRHRDGKEKVELRYFITNATTGMLTPWQLLKLVRLHWSIENDCNWTFDMQFGEDDGAWCTQQKATLVLGALRMIAYNMLQWLRKVHLVVRRERVPDTPWPWRSLFELMHRYLLAVSQERMRRCAGPPTLAKARGA